MSDDERAAEVERLLKALSETRARRKALLSELQELTAMLPQIRAAFGNPFFYSRPEDPGESADNYTGSSSHDVFVPTIQALRRVTRELGRIKERLKRLGVPYDDARGATP